MKTLDFPALRGGALLLPKHEGQGVGIRHMSDPLLPQFSFEWHPLSKKVYVVHLDGHWSGDGEFVRDSEQKTAKGQVIAEHADHHAMAYGFVQTYCRGFKEACVMAYQKNKRLGSYMPDRITHTSALPVR